MLYNTVLFMIQGKKTKLFILFNCHEYTICNNSKYLFKKNRSKPIRYCDIYWFVQETSFLLEKY